MRKISVLRPALLALALGSLPLGSALAQTIYGLQTNNTLVSFSPTAPAPIPLTTVGAISGVTVGQTLVGMDFRPATGELIALGYDQATTSAQLYTLNLTTAAATAIAASFTINLGAESAANIGFDFNPTVDRIRVVSADINANFRLNPITGGIAFTDGNLAYAPADIRAARNPNVGAVAYSNSYLGATSTTLYDADLDFSTLPGGVTVILAEQNPPNSGTLNSLNSGVQPPQLSDVDIDVYTDLSTGLQTGYAMARYTQFGTDANALGVIDFTTATIGPGIQTGTAPTATPIVDIAVRIDRTMPPVTGTIAWALQTATNSFVTFDTNNPTFIRNLRPITGVSEPQIAGLDTRPATGELFALGYDPGSSAARLYTVNLSTGAATAIGAGPVTLTGVGGGAIGFDFNPTVDRIRVVSTTGKNYRLNPNDGTIAGTDGDLAYAAGDPNFGTSTNIGSAAYTNSFGGTTTTTLYTIDEQLTILNTQVPPNAGTQNTVGPLGLTLNPADRTIDLDIRYNFGPSPSNTAFLVANTGSNVNDNLYTVDLATGTATLVGRIGGGIPIRDIALRITPPSVTWTGAVSTDYNTPGNWAPAVVPIASTNVLIPAEVSQFPVLTGSGAANIITINSGASLTLAAGAALDMRGNLVNNGTFASSLTGSTSLGGAAAQTISGSGATTFGNLTVPNAAGASIDPANPGVQVAGVLSLIGSLTTNGATLTLLSNAASTAMVVNNGGVVNGNATVQRYITSTAPGIPGLGYRHLSAPVSNTTVGDLATAGFTPVVNPAYNTPANPINVKPYPNVFGFNEARFPTSGTFSQGYFSPASLATPLIQGRGYSVYMPGTSKPDFVGTLGNGNVTLSGLTRTGNFNAAGQKSGWHLLGNPYPSPIDWDLVTVPAGMDPTIYVLRTTGGNNGVYSTRVNGIGAPGTDLVGMGQGFFAIVTTNNVDFTFTNACRVTSYANPAVYRATADPRPLTHLTLRRADQAADLADAAYVYFQDGATAAVERGFDSPKMRAEGEAASIFTLAGGQELAINGQAAAALEGATVPLGVVLPVAGTYELNVAELRGFAEGTPVVLVDRRTNTTYDLTQQQSIRFSAAAGADLTRFSLRFGRKADASAASTLSLDVYPNPTNSAAGLTVTALGIGQGTTADATLYDALGRVVIRQTVLVEGEAASFKLDTRALRTGAYTLRLTTANGTPLTRQVVIE